MTNYTKGRAHEYRIKSQLEKEGWLVIRSAGSHSIIDLIAITYPPNLEDLIAGKIKLIQCKTGRSKKRAIKEVEKSDIKKYEGLYEVSVEVL